MPMIKKRSTIYPKWLDVPHTHSPKAYMCSETSKAMYDAYKGILTNPLNVECEAFEVMEECMTPFDCKIKGDGTLKDLVELINLDEPIMVRIVPEGQEERHTVVVVGYSASAIWVNDPDRPKGKQPIRNHKFLDMWDKTGRLYLDCSPDRKLMEE